MAWAGVAAGAVAVSGALVAILHESDDAVPGSEAPAGAAGRSGPSTERQHEFARDYGGPVWITVEAPDPALRTVTVRWGPWLREIVHEGPGAVSYEFTKRHGTRIPLRVTVEPAATVEFGSGTPPPDAVDVNTDWEEAP